MREAQIFRAQEGPVSIRDMETEEHQCQKWKSAMFETAEGTIEEVT